MADGTSVDKTRVDGVMERGEEPLVEARWARSIEDALDQLEPPWPEEARAELEAELIGLAGGDLRGQRPVSTAAARAVRIAVEAFGDRLQPVRRALLLLPGAPADEGAPRGLGALDEARRLLTVTGGRLAELTHLSERLAEVAAQAGAAALNVTIELTRDGEAHRETLTALSEEVRRFTERTDAVTRRVTRLGEALLAEHQGVVERLEAEGDRRRRLGSGPLPAAALSLLSRVFSDSVHLPPDEVEHELARRLSSLREQLEETLSQLIERFPDETPSAVERSLDEIEALLKGAKGGGAGEPC